MQNYCLNDFVVCEEHFQNFKKVQNKNDSKFYYLKKYPNKNLDEKKQEIIQKLLIDLADITKMELKGLFTGETKEGKDLYLIFEFFNGKLVCSENIFQNHETWIIAKNLLKTFEKLSEKGIKFNKNENSVIDVFEIDLNEIKINIFDLINDDIKEENDENNGMLFNIGLILDKIRSNDNDNYNYKNYIFKGIKNDLKNNKLDITTSKILFNLFFKYSLYFDNKNPEIIDYNSGIYCGSLKDNKPDGMGVLVKECDIIYKGEFKEGIINGKGKSFIYDKNDKHKKLLKIIEGTFIGEIKNGKYTEYDRYDCRYEIFEGEYKDDKREGKGIEYNQGNKLFEVEYKDGKREGKGIEYYDEKKVYEGEYKDGKREGKGIEYTYGNKLYEGEYKDGKREGKGIEYTYDYNCHRVKKLYEGEYKDGKKNGYGVLYTNDEIKIYEGNFINNFFHGDGKLFYDNGRIQYNGKFNNGFKVEEGFYYDYANYGQKIKVFNGLPLINNEFPKVFKIYYNDGRIHYTISLNNYQLEGREYNRDGKKIYSGDFKQSLIKDGHGKSYDSYGYLIYEGDFKNDLYNGKGKEYYDRSSTLKYEGEFCNGKYNGYGIKYNDKGEKEFDGIFQDNKLKTGFKKIDESGYEGQIDNNLKEGKGKQFIDNILRFEGTFKKDYFVEGIVYDINGKIFFDGKISNDNKKIGKFYENNEVIFEGRYDDFYKMANYMVDFTNRCEINYEGEYKNGMKCGEGNDYKNEIYYNYDYNNYYNNYYKVTKEYTGEFLYGMRHGKGEFYLDHIKGEFKNGKKTGFWKNNDGFEGEYKDGIINGKGKFNGWTGYYVNGYLHGISRKDEQKINYYFGEQVNILNLRIENNCIYFNGIKEYEGDIINNDIKHGKGTEYYNNKNKRYEGSFQYGKHHGYGKEYYYDKEILKYEGEFKNGLYDKEGKEYDENGKIVYEGGFKDGKYHGKGKLYRNGKIVYQGDFEDNKLQGKGIEYNEEGQIVYDGEFKNNAYNGWGKKNLYAPYEGFWYNNRPDKLKQGIYSVGKWLKIA